MGRGFPNASAGRAKEWLKYRAKLYIPPVLMISDVHDTRTLPKCVTTSPVKYTSLCIMTCVCTVSIGRCSIYTCTSVFQTIFLSHTSALTHCGTFGKLSFVEHALCICMHAHLLMHMCVYTYMCTRVLIVHCVPAPYGCQACGWSWHTVHVSCYVHTYIHTYIRALA